MWTLESQKSDNLQLQHWEFLHFVRAEITEKSKFRPCKIVRIQVIETLHFAKIDFTQK